MNLKNLTDILFVTNVNPYVLTCASFQFISSVSDGPTEHWCYLADLVFSRPTTVGIFFDNFCPMFRNMYITQRIFVVHYYSFIHVSYTLLWRHSGLSEATPSTIKETKLIKFSVCTHMAGAGDFRRAEDSLNKIPDIHIVIHLILFLLHQ